jgi:Ankyrin repeats (many copies)
MVPCEIVCDDSLVDNDDFGSCSEEAARRAPIELLSLMVNQEWEIVYDWLEDEPELTHQWNYGIETECDETLLWKRLPIHSACRQGAPVSVLSIILRHNPSCPPDPYTGSLPIHLACRHFPKLSTVQVLLYTDPTSSRRQDNSGKLALHYAVMHKAPKSVLQLLLKSYPTSVITEDNNGHTPLDYCALECMDANVLKTMMRLKSFLGRVETRKQREMMRNQSSNMCLAIGSKSDDYIL